MAMTTVLQVALLRKEHHMDLLLVVMTDRDLKITISHQIMRIKAEETVLQMGYPMENYLVQLLA